MKPFVLKQHDQDFAAIRELRDEEVEAVSGGYAPSSGKGTFTRVGELLIRTDDV